MSKTDPPSNWRGKGVEETGVDVKSGKTVVRIDPTYFRPTEVDFLVGDATFRAPTARRASCPTSAA